MTLDSSVLERSLKEYASLTADSLHNNLFVKIDYTTVKVLFEKIGILNFECPK